MMNWCILIIAYYLFNYYSLLLLNICVGTIIYLLEYKFKLTNLFEINFFYKNKKVFTVKFDQLNASLLNPPPQ